MENESPRQLTLEEWDHRIKVFKSSLMQGYCGSLKDHLSRGDSRLLKLKFDNSPAALKLWNFLLSEEERLFEWKKQGKKLIGTMKDLGTVPVIAYAHENLKAFYPDGAWWIPCIMETHSKVLSVADSLGIDESFCPVRAMLGAFVTGNHFPIPDLLTCSTGATCDDFSAIAQRLPDLGHPILWWNIPARRKPETEESAVLLPGGWVCPKGQVNFVVNELTRVKEAMELLAGECISEEKLKEGIRKANQVRSCLWELRTLAFKAELSPMPSLELLIAEMFAIHFCSDREEALTILQALLAEVKRRIENNTGYFKDAARIFWINPVADLRVMNLLEECGGRVCGTDYMVSHAFEEIPENLPPMEALARMALSDPMIGSSTERALKASREALAFGSEAFIISKIPGASHCALEGKLMAETIREQTGLPVLEIEVPPVCDSLFPSLKTRIKALVETVKEGRKQ